MRKFTYCEYDPVSDQQDKLVTKTKEEVLREYYPFWSQKMREAGKGHLVNPKNCIDDWCIIHWAVEKIDG